jgi:hypothetical protein
MTAETETMVGQYVSDGTYKILQLPTDVNFFQIWNYTDYGSSANPGIVKRASWFNTMPNDYYLGTKNTDGAATDESVLGTSGGFRWLESQPNNLEAAGNAITAITAATPPVVSKVAHGYQVGDTVQLTATTGMLQIAGYEATVTVRDSANAFSIGYIPGAGFAAAATAGVARRISTPPMFAPRRRYITAITQATSAVVTLSVTHGYQVGEKVRFNVSSDWDMTEIDGLLGEITAISTANNTITVDIDSSAFTAFAWPASGDTPFTPAHVVPVGDDPSVLTGATNNEGYRALRIGATVDGADGDEMKWIALKAGYNLIET